MKIPTDLREIEITSRTVPGFFDQLDAGLLDEDDPEILKFAVYETDETDAQTVLIGSEIFTSLDFSTLRETMKRIRSWLKGYRKKTLIHDKTPVWVSLIELYSPPGGEAIFEHTSTSENTKGPEFEIAGINFGASQVVNISKSIGFGTTSGRALQLEMLATIIERENESTGDKMYEGRLEPRADYIARRFQDLSPLNLKESDMIESKWTKLETIDARPSPSTGPNDVHTHTYKIQKVANWKVGIGLSIPELAKFG